MSPGVSVVGDEPFDRPKFDGGGEKVVHMSVAPAEGAIFLPHLSLVVRRAFLSPTSLAERSSPSRVRFAAPNNGAPLTAQGRSELTPPDKRERLIPEGCGHLGAKGAKMAPFFTATDMLGVI